MKSLPAILVAFGFLLAAGGLSSQPAPAAPKPPVAAAPAKPGADPMAVLKQMKADNAALLDRQTTVLKALDVLGEEARQLRIFAKRG